MKQKCSVKDCNVVDDWYLENCNPKKLCFMHYWGYWK